MFRRFLALERNAGIRIKSRRNRTTTTIIVCQRPHSMPSTLMGAATSGWHTPVSGLQVTGPPSFTPARLNAPPPVPVPDVPPVVVVVVVVLEPAAPPVASAHWVVAPCLSQAEGIGAFLARVFSPDAEKVGLWHDVMLMFCATTPGIRLT